MVYGIICPCGLLYVGCTIRPLRVRFGEHKCSIINNKQDVMVKDAEKNKIKSKNKYNYSVPRHFKDHHHNRSPAGMKVFGIKAIIMTLVIAEDSRSYV